MHVYFSGIGGAGIGPLALIAHQAGHQVSGSDKQDSSYLAYLREHGVKDVHVGQSYEAIRAVHARTPIDWLVFSSAVTKEQTDPPELRFCHDNHIRTSKRDEFLSEFLEQQHLKLIAVAGTHGKTTTTAMAVWLCKQLGLPVSYSVGAKLGFGEMGAFDSNSDYFIYEADEYDRNFLAFHPHLSLISGIDWDHPDIYPTREAYNAAFGQFLGQSEQNIVWHDDLIKLEVNDLPNVTVISEGDPRISDIKLAGLVNRQNALLVACGLQPLLKRPFEELIAHLNRFPGLSRRFEEIAPGLYSDYAHTPPKIEGALGLAREVAGNNVVVVYEGLHNTRQHFIKEDLYDLFEDVKQLYIVPSYLAREDPNLPTLTPGDLKKLMSPDTQSHTLPQALDDELKRRISQHLAAGDTVLCLTAGGGGSLDEWLRSNFKN